MKPSRPTPLIARISLLIVGMLTAVFGLNGAAYADTTPVPGKADLARAGVVSSSQDGVKTAAARAWSPAEMLSAKPFPEPKASRAETATDLAAQARPDGAAGSVAPKQPDGRANLAFAVNPGSYASFPYSTVGKLFFTQYGTRYVCSGAMIKGHAFWTAGHCAHAGNNSSGGWSYNAVFVPQYYYGSAPLGYCYVQNWWTTTDWYAYGNPYGLDHDYAGGNLSCDRSNIASYTGYLGLAWNQSYSQTWTALGYPQAAPYDGGRMIGCVSGRAAYGFGSPTTFGIVCNMTGGSSGGPLHILGGYVNGNVSYGDSSYPGLLFSPYFNSGVKTLWDNLWS